MTPSSGLGASLRSACLLLAAAALSGCGGAQQGTDVVAPPSVARQLSTEAHLWLDAEGRPTAAARQGLNLLRQAHTQGLEPADYAVDQLAALATLLDDENRDHEGLATAFVHLLPTELLHYLRHLTAGRVDPRDIGFRFTPRAPPSDLDARLRDAAARGAVNELAASLQPARVEYAPLLRALERYRSLATNPDLSVVLPISRTIRPGDTVDGLGSLRRLLEALGDLAAGSSLLPGSPTHPGIDSGTLPKDRSDAVYDEPLVAAVKRFQARHNLEPDGVIGRETLAALRVPLTWRARQIELALERLRWIPDPGDLRSVVVNIPMFELAAWERGTTTEAPSIAMRVIVGTPATPTPVIAGVMRTVILRPYWNVPASILRREILPLLARDPDYLERNQMEIVRGGGDNAEVMTPSPEHIADLRRGLLRLRQRPGPHNALGLVRFHFENEEQVYLHGTSAPALFERARRAFSHGCMRVEAPMRLAAWALEGAGSWTEERLTATAAAGPPRELALASPVHIAIVYITAAATPDGVVRFAEDLYGHDSILDRALRSRGLTFQPAAGGAIEGCSIEGGS